MTEAITSAITRVARIKQILPADGWEMEFKSKTGQKRQELACWAICESIDGKEFVTGLFAQVAASHAVPSFQPLILILIDWI